MPHRIIVLSDGTGNSAAAVWRTNVWRIFEFLDLTSPDQVAKYDDGVGSSSFKPLAILGGAFGWGLKRNLLDLYKFVCRDYRRPSADKPGSQIYTFGFSRGAFTIRLLVGLILEQGLVPYYGSESDLDARAKAAYRAFRAERFRSVLGVERVFRKLRDGVLALRDRFTGRKPYDKVENTVVPSIEFIGIWDTVAAYGLPIEEMTRGFSRWIWPLELPSRTLHPKVQRACHALALDDERTTFHPVLWTEEGEHDVYPWLLTADTGDSRSCWFRDERISQVWFAGSHSNVGGGYPDDALAYIPLHWMMEEARIRGLAFKAPPADPDAFRRAASARDKDGRQYDSRAGVAGYYRYGPRKIADLCNMRLPKYLGDSVRIELPKIHETALLRLRSGGNAYAPIGIPAEYAVAMSDGRILRGADNPYETPNQAAGRAADQERIWNLVWLRRIVYFATVIASFHLAAFWLFHDLVPQREFESPVKLVSEFVRLVESFLPRQVVHWWTDYYTANPISFLLGVIAVAVLISIGSRLGSKIADSMRIIWNARAPHATTKISIPHSMIYAFRTSKPYQWVLNSARHHVLPFLSAIFLLWLGAGALSHFLFNVFDSAGVFCHPTDEAKLEKLEGDHRSSAKEIIFPTNAICFATGVRVEAGARYTVRITEIKPWVERGVQPTHPIGFRILELPHWWMGWRYYATLPLRRVLFRSWFDVVARVGAEGIDEDFLDPRPIPGGAYYVGGTERLKRSGELFLYVNDAVIALPWLNDVFYWNNQGTARIVVTRSS